jgi:hypothetical protein
MKIKIGIDVDVRPTQVSRWLGLEGQELLDAVKDAADSGEEVTISIGTKKAVKILPLSTPPMFRGFDDTDLKARNGN